MRRRLLLACVLSLGIFLTASAQGASVPAPVRQAAVAGQRVWVFLKDKGPDALRRRAPAADLLSTRASIRLRLRGTITDPALDLPIHAQYRQALSDAGMQMGQQSRWLNAVSGTIDARDLEAIAALPFVDSLRVVAVGRMPLPDTTPTIAPSPRVEGQSGDVYDYGPSRRQIAEIQVNFLHAAGLSGQGVRIGMLDTGFSLGITVFSHMTIVGTRDFINGDADVSDGEAAQMRHGTQTLSLCGGLHEGHLVGVAPDAEFAVGKTEIVGLEIQAEEDNWIAGLEWLDSLGCDLVSSSLGYVDWYTHKSDYDGNTALCTIAADLAASRGLLVVNAVGNYGDPCDADSIIVPADGDSVLAVGAADSLGNRASFSSCGPTFDGRIKPDVIAPGVNVMTALPNDAAYSLGNGTSFATPLVAGVCALLLEHDPTLTPYQLIERLRATATKARKPLSTYGWGLVQAAKAAGIAIPTVEEIVAYPNPASDAVNIVVPDVDAGDKWTFQVFTAAGQPVYSNPAKLGALATWRGVTDSGEKAATGVYLILVRTALRQATIKVAWVSR